LTAASSETSGTPALTRLNFQVFMDGLSTATGPALAHVMQPSYDVSISSHGTLGSLAEGYHYSTLGTFVGPNGGTLALNNVQNSVNVFG
jgi:hypothetical protein